MISVKEFQKQVQERIWNDYKEKTQKKSLTYGNYLALSPLVTFICGLYMFFTYKSGNMNIIGFMTAFMSFFFMLPSIFYISGYINFQQQSNYYYTLRKEEFRQTFKYNKNNFMFYGRANNQRCIFLTDGYNAFFEKPIGIPSFIDLFYLNSSEMKMLGELNLNEKQKLTLLEQLKTSSQYHQYDLNQLQLFSDDVVHTKEIIENQNLANNFEIVSKLKLNT